MGSSLAIKGGILLAAVFLILKFGLPLFTAPLPMSLIWLYLFLTTIGIIVFGTLSSHSTEALLGPIFGLRKNRSGDQGNQRHSRK